MWRIVQHHGSDLRDPGWREIESVKVPRDGWLVMLAQGWNLPEPLECNLAHCGPHSVYETRMWRIVR